MTELRNLYNCVDCSLKLGFLRIPGGGVIEIFEFSKTLPAEKVCWNKPGVTHLTLNVANTHKMYKRLKDKGVEFFSVPQHSGGADWVFMKDPDGNLIEIIDLKFNYYAIKYLGRLVGCLLKATKFKNYYK